MGNEGPLLGTYASNYGPSMDFQYHDNLPPKLRKWYREAIALWAAAEAEGYLGFGKSEEEIIARMERLEQNTMINEAEAVWGKDYPIREIMKGKTNVTKAHPVPRLRRSDTQLYKQMARSPRVPRSTNARVRWGSK